MDTFSQPAQNVAQFPIEPNMKVADLGSGSGHYSIELSKIVTDGTVYAVDVQKELLERLKNLAASDHGATNIETIWGDIEEEKGSTLADQSVDRAVISNTLFQVDHKEGLAQEAFRILKPGGKLLFVDWSESFGNLGPTPEMVVTRDKALEIFQAAGFQFEKEIATGAHHYGFIMKK